MNVKNKKRVLVAMSGGVDSSVAAALLVSQGYEVIGATMQVWDYSKCDITEGQGTCCSSIDVDDARAVADKLEIPFYVINCESEFKQKVINPFVESYQKGETPLPCSNCNTYLKFDHLIKKMNELECDYLATGHYVQVENQGNEYALLMSEDSWKDQSYFLFTLPQKILPQLLFPLGEYNKKDVRTLAAQMGLLVAQKKDSTGICFVGNGQYSQFVESKLEKNEISRLKGLIKRYPTGETMARHQGIHYYTVGQSRGLGMSHHEKLFVLHIDSEDKTVWVGDEKYLYHNILKFDGAHWLTDSVGVGQKVLVKIRSTHPGSLATITTLSLDRDKVTLEFDEPQRAITPGQAAVLYDQKKMLGGGWIQESGLVDLLLQMKKKQDSTCEIKSSNKKTYLSNEVRPL